MTNSARHHAYEIFVAERRGFICAELDAPPKLIRTLSKTFPEYHRILRQMGLRNYQRPRPRPT